MCQESAEEAIAELPAVDQQPSEKGLPLGTQPLGDVVEGLFSHKEGLGDKMEKPVMGNCGENKGYVLPLRN